MRYRPARTDSVILSNHTAFALCNSSLQMARFWIIELPEPELREVRSILGGLLVRADQVLDLMENEISLDFEGRPINSNVRYPPGAEDFGAVVVSSVVTSDMSDIAESDIGEQEFTNSDIGEQEFTDSDTGEQEFTNSDIGEQEFTDSDTGEPDIINLDIGEFHSVFSSLRPGVTNRISVPAMAMSLPPAPASTPVRSPTPAPEPIPAPIVPNYHGHHPLVISSRENVGLPNYAYHPHFVRPGVPGTYFCPPTPYGKASSGPYIAITKGLYVGIFTNWEEVEPWVVGISGSKYRKSRSWESARDIYNARLAADAVEVLP